MTPVIRLWLAFAAMGAALIHLAVGASAPLPLAIPLVGFGVAELGWGVACLTTGRLLVPRVALVAAVIPILIWGAAATLGGALGLPDGALPLFPMAVASLFNLFVAGVLAVIQRRGANTTATTDAAEQRDTGWRFVAALIVGGAVLSGLTTPALAATEAGKHAVPHGTHSVPGLELPGSGHDPH